MDARDTLIEMQRQQMDALQRENDAMLGLLIELQSGKAKGAQTANAKRWRKTFGIDDLPAALRRAAFYCNHDTERHTAKGWQTIASLYVPPLNERPTYLEVLAKLLERLQGGLEGTDAARLFEGVPVAELQKLIDKGTVADAFK